MQLSPPPLWQQLLLEDPRPLVVALAVAALVLAIVARRVRDRPSLVRRFWWAAGGALVLAAGVYLLASAVTTTRERLLIQTRQMISLAAPLDTQRFAQLQQLFDPAGECCGPDLHHWLSMAEVLALVRDRSASYDIREHKVTALAAEARSSREGRAIVSVQTAGNLPDGLTSVPSEWLIDWSRDDDGRWRISRLTCLSIHGRRELAQEIMR